MTRSASLLGLVLAVSSCAVTDDPSAHPDLTPGSGGSAGASGSSGSTGCGASTSSGASSGDGATTGAGATGSGASPGCGASAGAGGTGGGGPPVCDDADKRCQHEFSYPDSGQTSVEVRGNFAPDGWTNGVPLTKQGGVWSASVEVPYAAPVEYKFVIDGTTWVTDPNNPSTVPDGVGGENSLLAGVDCESWTCVPPTLGTFDWRDAVLYFVFVDRFENGDPTNDGPPVAGVEPAAGYQGGDWAGVRKKLQEGYFTDLGVNVLWLSAPIDNPSSAGSGTDGHQYSAYHGYWPKTLDTTEERFGTLAELQALVQEAHAAGIKIILDYVMNHVHVESPVYQQHADWFWPLDVAGKKCVCGEGCSWEGADGKRCWFRDYLPDFDFNNGAARDFSVENAISWIGKSGVDGFRLDAVKHIEEAWVTDLRSRVSTEIEPVSGEHFYMVGETFTGSRDEIKYWIDPKTKLDGQFDFPLRAQVVSALLLRSAPLTELDAFLQSNEGFYGAGVMSTFVGNHDVPRSIHFAEDAPLWQNAWADGKDRAWSNQPGLPGGTSAFERLANAQTLIFTLRGVPLVYYGDEVGLPGAGDPDNRRKMQWSNLSAGQTLLLEHTKKLAKIRADHPALRRGTGTTLSVDADTLVYRMQHNADTVFVAINRSDATRTVTGLPGASFENLLDGSTISGPSLTLAARRSAILVSK